LGALSRRCTSTAADNASPFTLCRSTPNAFFFPHCYGVLETRLRCGTIIANLFGCLCIVVFVIWKKYRSINSTTGCDLLPCFRTWRERERTLVSLANRDATIRM
jgi:hypothetical protein